MNPTFRIKLIHGVIVHEDHDRYTEYLKGLKHDWPYEMIVRPIVKPRTDRQNRYYWGVVIELITMELCGTRANVDKEETHRSLAEHFLTDGHVNMVGGVPIKSAPPSTTSLSTIEFNEYIEVVRRWAAEFIHLDIPDPEEVDH